ncbi:MAG: hypothetical protein ACLTDV_03175 [Eubacterium sp.]
MGREADEIWYEQTDLTGVQVLLLEWTHGGSEYLEELIFLFIWTARRKRHKHAGFVVDGMACDQLRLFSLLFP